MISLSFVSVPGYCLRISKSPLRHHLFSLLILFPFLFLTPTTSLGQVTEPANSPVATQNIPSVFVDCNRCDYDHIRREIPFVNYVREPQQASVHLFITDQRTGDGGREYELSFIGREQFSEMNYDFKHTVGRDATGDESREELIRVIRLGLMPYVLQTSGADRFNLDFEPIDETAQPTVSRETDPWRQWVFEIYAGSLSLDMESNRVRFDSRWGFYANKVSEKWKVQFRPYFNYDFVEIQRVEEEDPLTSRRHRHGINSYAIRSINDHWSAGLFGTYLTRNDRNIRHRFQLNPGIEYSLLPYDVATRRAITFVYRIGLTSVDYYDETIFEKTRENLLNHELSVSVGIQQPWGSIQSGLIGSHYLHDFEKRRAEFFGRISIRIVEGFSVRFGGSFEMVRDQLSLRRGDASLEDVLLRQQELATDFELSGFVALTYTFGSDFANIVNTRF